MQRSLCGSRAAFSKTDFKMSLLSSIFVAIALSTTFTCSTQPDSTRSRIVEPTKTTRSPPSSYAVGKTQSFTSNIRTSKSTVGLRCFVIAVPPSRCSQHPRQRQTRQHHNHANGLQILATTNKEKLGGIITIFKIVVIIKTIIIKVARNIGPIIPTDIGNGLRQVHLTSLLILQKPQQSLWRSKRYSKNEDVA